MIEPRVPRRAVPGCQLVEYLRAFLLGRSGWDTLGALMIVSGAFGMFRRDLLEGAGGYWTQTVGEDLEMTLRLHRRLREFRPPVSHRLQRRSGVLDRGTGGYRIAGHPAAPLASRTVGVAVAPPRHDAAAALRGARHARTALHAGDRVPRPSVRGRGVDRVPVRPRHRQDRPPAGGVVGDLPGALRHARDRRGVCARGARIPVLPRCPRPRSHPDVSPSSRTSGFGRRSTSTG